MSSFREKLKEKLKEKSEKLDTEKKEPVDERGPERIKKQKQNLKTGGRAMYKSGMRVCKLAKKGKGRAYGKNS